MQLILWAVARPTHLRQQHR